MLGRDGMFDPRGSAATRLAPGAPAQIVKNGPPSLGLSTPDQRQPPPQSSPSSTSILGPDITIIGQQLILKTKGSLLIQGQIQGDVHGATVTVDDGANVTGVIVASTIAVQGGVKGALKGSSVILHANSHVEADIVHQTLAIAEGAQFEGSVRRARDISEVTPDLS